MARGLNKVMIIGYLGRDPEMRYTPSNRPVTSFSVATTRTWTSSEGERREETEWFNVVAWGTLAEICKTHLSKNQQVYIEGRLGVEEWTDRDGKERYTLAVTATDMQFIGTRADNAGGGEYSGGSPREDHDSGFTGTAPAASSSATASAPVSAPAAADDDIPF